MRVLKKINPNLWEELYFRGYEIIQDEVDSLIEKSWEFNEEGDPEKMDYYNEAANYHYYLMIYAVILAKHLERTSSLDITQCEALSMFKIDCIEEKLQCMSINKDTDLWSTWKKLKEAYGIDLQCEDTECCLGLGEFIIDDPDDCKAWIIGGCEENQESLEASGEFDPCEFDPEEVANDPKTDLSNCN